MRSKPNRRYFTPEFVFATACHSKRKSKKRNSRAVMRLDRGPLGFATRDPPPIRQDTWGSASRSVLRQPWNVLPSNNGSHLPELREPAGALAVGTFRGLGRNDSCEYAIRHWPSCRMRVYCTVPVSNGGAAAKSFQTPMAMAVSGDSSSTRRKRFARCLHEGSRAMMPNCAMPPGLTRLAFAVISGVS